jgi:hypothetical protein
MAPAFSVWTLPSAAKHEASVDILQFRKFPIGGTISSAFSGLCSGSSVSGKPWIEFVLQDIQNVCYSKALNILVFQPVAESSTLDPFFFHYSRHRFLFSTSHYQDQTQSCLRTHFSKVQS